MDTHTVIRNKQAVEALPAQEEYSILQIAEELTKDINQPDIESIAINLFYRIWAKDFDFSRINLLSDDIKELLDIDGSIPYSEGHGGIVARLHNQQFKWLGNKLDYYYDCEDGIKTAIQAICIQNFFYKKNIRPDYEEMLNNPLVLAKMHTQQLELSEKQRIYLFDKYLPDTQDASLYTGKYSEWVKSLPKEYADKELEKNFENLPRVSITKEALINYITMTKQVINWNIFPVFFEEDTNKHFTTILKEFTEYHINEAERFILILAKHLFITKEDLLHWVRLGRNAKITTMRSEYIYPHITFLGDIWENTPFAWNPNINDVPHLSLKDAWKYYSDSHLWDLYAQSKARLDGIWPVHDNDKASVKRAYESAYTELKATWLEHFRRGKLKMYGYKGKTLEKFEFDTDMIDSLLSSDRFDFDKNEIIDGDITGIKVMKVLHNNMTYMETENPEDAGQTDLNKTQLRDAGILVEYDKWVEWAKKLEKPNESKKNNKSEDYNKYRHARGGRYHNAGDVNDTALIRDKVFPNLSNEFKKGIVDHEALRTRISELKTKRKNAVVML